MAKKLFFLVIIVVGSIFFLSLEADANGAISHEGRKAKIGNHVIGGKNNSRRLESKNEQNVQGFVHRESEGHEENKETIADKKYKDEENDRYKDDECGEDQECDNNDDDDDDDDNECGEGQECDNNDDNEDDDDCGEDQDCDNDDHDGDGDGENDEDECNKDGDDGDDQAGDEEGGEHTPRRRAKRGDVKPQIKNRGNALRGRDVHDKPPCPREVSKPHK